MIVRVLTRACAGLAVVALVAACDNNPLAENRDRGAWFELNPSNVAVNAGGTVKVTAVVRNQYGAATNAAVTATPCDAKISAVRDTSRSAFEFPERFEVTGSNALGNSCLVVSGGGLTDTIGVRVVPASIRLVGLDTVGSGQSLQGSVRFLTTTGADATGFNLSNVEFVSLTPSIAVVDSTGLVSGQAPGQGQVLLRLRTGFGVTRVDTARFVVRAGSFGGTVAQQSYLGAQALVFTQGAIAFDADTEVRIQVPAGQPFGTLTPTAVGLRSGNTATAMLPLGLPAGTVVNYEVVNIGPNQVAQVGSFTTTAATPATDALGATNTARATAPTMTVGTDVFGTISAGKPQVWYRFVAARTGNHTLTVHWSDGSDVDAYIRSETGTALLSRETLQHPETGTVSLTQGTVYYVHLFMYEAATAGNTTFRIRVQ